MKFGLRDIDFTRFTNHVITQASEDDFSYNIPKSDGLNHVFLSLTNKDKKRKNSLLLEDETDSEFVYVMYSGTPEKFQEEVSTEVVVGNNSKLRFHIFCAGAEETIINHTINVKIGKNSDVQISFVGISGKDIKTVVNVDFLGENSCFNAPALLLPEAEEHFDFQTFINHNVANCKSKQVVRTIASGNGFANFFGLIKVAKNSQKTEAEQVNNNILLSEDATINSKPQLEIYADDVKCSHGSTTGMLDKEALFYMRSRGISEKTAQNLLLMSFIEEVSNAIESSDDYKKYLQEQIETKLK